MVDPEAMEQNRPQLRLWSISEAIIRRADPPPGEIIWPVSF
jgi:hypothetical protein